MLSLLGIYYLVHYVPLLLPRNLIPYVAAALSEALRLLDRAEATGAITDTSEYRADLATFANQFLRIRAESHRVPGIFQQIVLAVRFRLTYKLYVISSQAEEIKIKVELALDELQLSTTQSTTTALPTPAVNIAGKKVAETTHTPPNAAS